MRMRSRLWVMPLLLAGCAGAPAPEAPEAVSPSAAPWTGEIKVTFTGCTSCADCRAAIRQISQIQSGSDHVEFHAGVARITYPGPAPLRAGEVARALSGAGVIKGQVDQVILKVEGQVLQTPEGREFAASGTGQRWRVSEASMPAPLGKPLLIEAALEGWRESGPPSLRILSAKAL